VAHTDARKYRETGLTPPGDRDYIFSHLHLILLQNDVKNTQH
jgi:hypothetical protein